MTALYFVAQTSLTGRESLRLRFSAGMLGRGASFDALLGWGPLEWKVSLRASSGAVPDATPDSGAAADSGLGGDAEGPTAPDVNLDADDSAEESRR
jgi:hypothetical protein